MGNTLVLRKATTKTKRTQLLPLHPKLKAVLGETGLPSSGYLFPGRGGQGPITRQACDAALRKASHAWACEATAPTATGVPGRLG